ncbi:MAG: ParB/RepB/Spo0J family partition protein [Gammaproteobacteria bacterium]|mgnify:FL=1|nr:ParB/RepB/Spo0J family partition protein [Gammaproteobacteria bacterium]MBT5643853.1 ParB/RepB/Spo0J family partition protein [Gammaproteobacteria bacterium]
MTKRKALGSGLEALLSAKPENKNTGIVSENIDNANHRILSIPVDKIVRNKDQPRQLFFNESLESMATSIKENGQLAPILVRKSKDGYEIIAGERRWRAMQSIKEHSIDAIVMDVDDKESALIAIVENVQREQLNVIEEAEALHKLHAEYNMTHDDIAKYTGKSRSHITNILRLNDLTQYVKSKLVDGSIEMGHARAVLSLDMVKQESIIKQAVLRKLSVRSVESLARNSRTAPNKKIKNIDQDTVSLEQELSEHLAANIKITHKADGAGKLEIKYKSLNELQGIVSKFKK